VRARFAALPIVPGNSNVQTGTSDPESAANASSSS